MSQQSPTTAAARVAAFRALHERPGMLVLPNAWDAASARTFASAGFPALATTSGGVAASLGYEDHEHAPVDEMLAQAARIIRSVELPVTVDFEAGYSLSPEQIAGKLIAIGATGLNLEDSDHHTSAGLVPAEEHARRLAAVKEAARRLGVDIFLNARVDVFIKRFGSPAEQLTEALRRARLYREAGADCIYPIILGDAEMISAMVESVGVINVTVRRGGPLSLQQAASLGVHRATYATSIFRETMAGVERIAKEIFDEVPPA